MVKRLQDQGFMTVQYGSGPNARQVPLDVYAMLCARSTTREAGNTAREIQLTENGYDLMEMTEHFPTCEVCAALQGKVFSISGNDKRFPPLSMAYRDGYHNVHPNCRHVMVPFIEEFNDVEEAIKRSNAPYKPNPENVKVYDEQQAKNRRERETLYQYERYKMRLGDDAPKSLSAFKRIKNADGDMWRFLSLDYKRRGELISAPEKALPNPDNTVAADGKFEKYLFAPESEAGYPKGIAISSRLGYNIDNWKDLQSEILKRSSYYPSLYKHTNQFGDAYEQKIVLYGKKGKPANVILGWMCKDGKTWLTSCYIKETRNE